MLAMGRPPSRTFGGSSRFSCTFRLEKMPRSSGQIAMPSRAIAFEGNRMSSRCWYLMDPSRRPTMPMIDFSVVVLPAPIGQLDRYSVFKLAEPHRLDEGSSRVVQLVEQSLGVPEVERVAALSLQRDAHVLEHREMREYRRDLERAHQAHARDARGAR